MKRICVFFKILLVYIHSIYTTIPCEHDIRGSCRALSEERVTLSILTRENLLTSLRGHAITLARSHRIACSRAGAPRTRFLDMRKPNTSALTCSLRAALASQPRTKRTVIVVAGLVWEPCPPDLQIQCHQSSSKGLVHSTKI
jgi:hypothetical protein